MRTVAGMRSESSVSTNSDQLDITTIEGKCTMDCGIPMRCRIAANAKSFYYYRRLKVVNINT